MKSKPLAQKKKVFGVYVDLDLYAELKKIADRREWSVCKTAAFAVRELVSREKKRRTA